MQKLFPAVLLCLLLSSCMTYHLSPESLADQFKNVQKENKVIIAPVPGVVAGNTLREVKCLDKNNQPAVLGVTREMGVKIIKKDSTRTKFYFDTLLISDSTITGSKTHFFGGINIRPIKLKDVVRIELQK